ncbi:MAG: efflux RND transporter periplasmic adaptor subunit [Bacteroidales bacterium]|nr:efflux RND transporter periplasmic adaptor subunit [Bacteroidales bacterium]
MKESAAIIIVLVLVTLSCKSRKTETDQTEKKSDTLGIVITREQFNSSGMQIGKLQEFDFAESVHANGYIEVPPQNHILISAVMAGYISYNPLLIGDKVKKGQVVAKMKNPDFIQLQQDFAEAQYQLNFMKTEYERQKYLSDENIASQKVYSKAEADYLTLKIKCEGLRKKLEMLNINPDDVLAGNIVNEISLVSPRDGFVAAENLNRGMYVLPGDVLLEVIDNSHLHLELYVFETDALKIHKNQDITFKVTQSGNEIFDGVVLLVGQSIEGVDRKVAVHGHIKNEESLSFVNGMYVEAQIIISHGNSIGLPNEAIISNEGQSYILVLNHEEDNIMYFEKRYVKIGRSGEEMTEVICKNDSCNVLIKGGYNLAMGI